MAAKHSDLTPYAAHLVVNGLLKAAGSDREVGPQRMYGLSKRDVVKSTCDLGGSPHRAHAKCEHVVFDGDDFARWAKAYVKGVLEGTRVRRVDVKALLAEYSA
jgi:hypothetical protein